MGVRDLVIRGRGDEELTPTVGVRRERLSRLMRVEREAPLQTDGEVWIRALPGAEAGERFEGREVVLVGDLFQKEVSQW